MTDTAARKPRLTVQLLDDLDVAGAVLTDEIDYLADALKQHQGNAGLLETLTAKHVAVTRARDWLARHVDAVRSQRSVGDDHDTND